MYDFLLRVLVYVTVRFRSPRSCTSCALTMASPSMYPTPQVPVPALMHELGATHFTRLRETACVAPLPWALGQVRRGHTTPQQQQYDRHRGGMTSRPGWDVRMHVRPRACA